MNTNEKAHQTKYFKAARILAKAITDLPEGTDPIETLYLWKTLKASAAVKRDAYALLDIEPRRFEHHTNWHPKLRQLRNDTDYGPQLFELF